MKPFICGICNTHVYNFTGGVLSGQQTHNTEQFEPIKGFPKPIQGSRMDCPNCGVNWNPSTIKETNKQIIAYG